MMKGVVIGDDGEVYVRCREDVCGEGVVIMGEGYRRMKGEFVIDSDGFERRV